MIVKFHKTMDNFLKRKCSVEIFWRKKNFREFSLDLEGNTSEIRKNTRAVLNKWWKEVQRTDLSVMPKYDESLIKSFGTVSTKLLVRRSIKQPGKVFALDGERGSFWLCMLLWLLQRRK